MDIISFSEKFEVRLSQPKTVNPGTIRVAYGVQEVSLYEKDTGKNIPTIFVVHGECVQNEVLIQQLFDWYSRQQAINFI